MESISNRMLKRTALVLCGILALGLALRPASAANGADDTEPCTAGNDAQQDEIGSDEAPGPEMQLMMAEARRYQLDLADSAERNCDARHLLAAAAFVAAATYGDESEAELQSRQADLLQRAHEAGPDDPLVLWMGAIHPCKDDAPCLAARAAQRLTEIDADNAAVWTLAFIRANDAGDTGLARSTLARAAQAPRHNDYLWEYTKLLARVTLDGPPLPRGAFNGGDGAHDNGSEVYSKLISSMGIALGVAMPNLGPLMRTCTPNGTATSDVALLGDCGAIAQTMATSGGSYLTWRAGLRLLEKLENDPIAIEQNRHDLRASVWLMNRSASVINSSIEDSDGAEQFARTMLDSPSELAFNRTLLVKAGIPLDPPADWQESDASYPGVSKPAATR